jgi:hypothetical protein
MGGALRLLLDSLILIDHFNGVEAAASLLRDTRAFDPSRHPFVRVP